MGAFDDVGHELRAKRQGSVGAVDVAGSLAVDNIQVVALLRHGDVRVFTGFDIACRSQDEQSAVAPSAEAVGGEPVEPNVAEAPVSTQHHVAEVLEVRAVWV